MNHRFFNPNRVTFSETAPSVVPAGFEGTVPRFIGVQTAGELVSIQAQPSAAQTEQLEAAS